MKKYIIPILIILLIAISGFLFFKSGAQKYVFLITLDTTRADYIDYSLTENNLTPNIAKLAADGVVFSKAYSLIPITLPSHASMLFSMPPYLLGVYNNLEIKKYPYPSIARLFKEQGYQTGAVISLGVLNAITGLNVGFDEYIENFRPDVWYKTAEEVNRDALALIKRKAGKKSFFWIHYSDPHSPYFPPHYKGNFTVSFQKRPIFSCNSIDQSAVKLEFEIEPGKNVLRFKTRIPTSPLNPDKIKINGITYMNFSIDTHGQDEKIKTIFSPAWRKITPRGKLHYFSKKRRSGLAFINKSEKNLKITLSFNYKLFINYNFCKKLYRQEVQYMDQHFGKLIDFLKENNMYKNSLFLVMGDHGEGLAEHKKLVGHVHYLNKLYVHVPLFVSGKGVKNKGTVREDLVSNLNIAPTLLEMTNIKKPKFMKGKSLFEPQDSNQLLLETYSPQAFSDGFSLIKFPYQILYYPEREKNKFEFINLEKDELGINNIYDQKENQKIKVELKNSVIKIAQAIKKIKKNSGKMSPEQMKILKSLGYL